MAITVTTRVVTVNSRNRSRKQSAPPAPLRDDHRRSSRPPGAISTLLSEKVFVTICRKGFRLGPLRTELERSKSTGSQAYEPCGSERTDPTGRLRDRKGGDAQRPGSSLPAPTANARALRSATSTPVGSASSSASTASTPATSACTPPGSSSSPSPTAGSSSATSPATAGTPRPHHLFLISVPGHRTMTSGGRSLGGIHRGRGYAAR
jgi:hypothetical protein